MKPVVHIALGSLLLDILRQHHPTPGTPQAAGKAAYLLIARGLYMLLTPNEHALSGSIRV